MSPGRPATTVRHAVSDDDKIHSPPIHPHPSSIHSQQASQLATTVLCSRTQRHHPSFEILSVQLTMCCVHTLSHHRGTGVAWWIITVLFFGFYGKLFKATMWSPPAGEDPFAPGACDQARVLRGRDGYRVDLGGFVAELDCCFLTAFAREFGLMCALKLVCVCDDGHQIGSALWGCTRGRCCGRRTRIQGSDILW